MDADAELARRLQEEEYAAGDPYPPFNNPNFQNAHGALSQQANPIDLTEEQFAAWEYWRNISGQALQAHPQRIESRAQPQTPAQPHHRRTRRSDAPPPREQPPTTRRRRDRDIPAQRDAAPAWAPHPAALLSTDCTACSDKHEGTAYKGGCEHLYCRECLIQMAKSSLSGSTSFPVSCCNKKFSDPLIISILPRNIRDRYSLRLEESHTEDPIYCPKVNCGWLVREVDGYGCRKCRTRVCPKCKKEKHHGGV